MTPDCSGSLRVAGHDVAGEQAGSDDARSRLENVKKVPEILRGSASMMAETERRRLRGPPIRRSGAACAEPGTEIAPISK
ncbi:hypothetical protein [Burkholderia sp. Bp9143]|uniref:hypothetical protein n=1 Tax=Burkholderia sp. Bp9143 TaxID=2184574 RepID=UPI000F59EC0A|nr:hypothetical protein [Burkholderia sp. Bp9143]